MSTLLLRLAGPMQSWGTQSRFETERDTGREPSKSGVIGLVCAALGRSRDEAVDDLANLVMGVRVDQEGVVQKDFYTAGGTHLRGDRYGVAKADGSRAATVVSNRYYLADADFLVGLEGDEPTLRLIDSALAAPRWQLYLGRKAFVPGVPVHIRDGLRLGVPLRTALTAEPWPRLGGPIVPPASRPPSLRLVLESTPREGAEVRFDLPWGAAYQHRNFSPRYVANDYASLGDEVPIRGA